MNESSLNKAALKHAYIFIRYRPRSEWEIRQRLIKHNYTEADIEVVIQYLKQHAEIDDQLFAKLWTESRLRKHYGPNRIARELTDKGIAAHIIEQQLMSVQENGNEHLKALIKKISARYAHLDKVTCYRRQFMYLQRRGFDAQDIHRVLR